MRRFLISTSFLLAVPAALYAQAWGSIDMSIPMANTGFILSQQIVTMTTPDLQTTSEPEPAAPVDYRAMMVTRVDPARSLAPATLAQHYPAEKRKEAEKVFRQMLTTHRSVMQRFGVADNDLSGAVAAFIAGNYMAYNNADFADASFGPLVLQMRGSLANNAALAAATPAERQAAFEQLAILGMMSATTQIALKAEPGHVDAAVVEAKMRAAGERNLRQFLGVDPAQVRLTPTGITF